MSLDVSLKVQGVAADTGGMTTSAATATQILNDLIQAGFGHEVDALVRKEYGEADAEAFIGYDPDLAERIFAVFRAEKADAREDLNGYDRLIRDYNTSEQPRIQWSKPSGTDADAPWVEVTDDGTVTVHSNAGGRENMHLLTIISLPQNLMRDVAKRILELPENQDETFPDNPTPWVL